MLQKKNFIKGINSDTADELLPNGMDRYRLNVRVISPENGNMGYIETMNGNTLVSYELPSGTNICIGAREYERFGKVYYFVWNEFSNHSILEYDIAENAIYLVLSGQFLNFDTENLITGINFIELDPNNHLLYWTDNFNEPRKLNIEKAKYFSAGDYINGYKIPFDPSWINRIKIPPTMPTYVWYNDVTKQVNYLMNKLYTFKVRFVYDDGEISACSPISPYAYPAVTRVAASEPTLTQDNEIDITISTGSSIVKRIQILAKETNETDYYQIVDIDKAEYQLSDDTVYTYHWWNDGACIPVLVSESIKLFDNVPLKSQSQEIITNRMMDGLITEGYDPVEIDTLIVHNQDKTFPLPVDNTGVLAKRSYLKVGGIYTYGIVYYDSANRSGTTNINRGNTTNFQDNDKYGTTLHVPYFNDASTVSPYTPSSYYETNWGIFNSPPSWATHYQWVRSKNNAVEKFFQFACSTVRYTDALGYDCNESVATDILIYINNTYTRFLEEYGHSAMPFEPLKGDRIRFISHPNYTTYSYYPALFPGHTGLIYSPLSVSGFGGGTIDYPFNDFEIISFNPTTGIVHIKKGITPVAFYPGSLFEIYRPAANNPINTEILYETGELYNIIEDEYGNRVHEGRSFNQILGPSGNGIPSSLTNIFVIGSGAKYSVQVTSPYGSLFTIGQEVKVVGSGYTIYGQLISVVTVLGTTTIKFNAFEYVGTPALGAVNTFIGASGSFISGDTYRPYLNMPWEMDAYGGSPDDANFPPTTYPTHVYRVYDYIESMNASYFFDSAASDYGRPNKIDPNFKQITRPSTIRYSEKFVPETNINGLSSVYDTSFETYEDQYGGIYKLYGEDQRLICFQELRIGQIPVHQAIYNAQDLTQTVGYSEIVLNPQMIYYAGVYGIGKNPESFAVYAKSKYFLDMKRGVLCRLSVDGITPISKTAFQDKFITDMCNNRINKVGGTPRAYGVYDVKFNEYIISFADYTYLNGKKFVTTFGDTIAFNEKINEFTTHYSFIPDFMSSAGVNIVSIKDGELYTHNTNNAQSEFYGSLNYPEVWVVLNANPENVKVFESMGLACVNAWEAYEITTPNGQLSNLIAEDFQLKENLNYAPIWRDINTPNLEPGTELFEGDPMRDRTFLVKLRFTQLEPSTFDIIKTKMYSVDLKYIVSNLHNR